MAITLMNSLSNSLIHSLIHDLFPTFGVGLLNFKLNSSPRPELCSSPEPQRFSGPPPPTNSGVRNVRVFLECPTPGSAQTRAASPWGAQPQSLPVVPNSTVLES